MPKRDERYARLNIKSNLKVVLPAITVAVLMAYPAAAHSYHRHAPPWSPNLTSYGLASFEEPSFARAPGPTYTVTNPTDYQRGGSN
jgi:hypothetical protein